MHGYTPYYFSTDKKNKIQRGLSELTLATQLLNARAYLIKCWSLYSMFSPPSTIILGTVDMWIAEIYDMVLIMAFKKHRDKTLRNEISRNNTKQPTTK